VIRVANPTTGVYTHIDWKNGYEGSGQDQDAGTAVRTTITATYGAMALGGTANIVTFKGLGGTLLGSTTTFDVANPTAGSCHTTSVPSPIRCLRVQVSVSGQVRMCDPSVASTDPRAC
jgi:type IV fimbrial biogenesis protein FimT